VRTGLSSTFVAAAHAQRTGEALVALVSIDHSDLGGPILRAGNYADVVSGGDTYTGVYLELQLPDDVEDNLPSARMTIGDPDLAITQAVRSLAGSAESMTVTFKLVLADSPDTVQGSAVTLYMRDATYDGTVVSCVLSVEDTDSEPYPCDAFTPANAPGLF
jgi:hypothetical protein